MKSQHENEDRRLVQLSFIPNDDVSVHKSNNGMSEWGTFKDSLRAPIHRWFTYPAGFSYKAVEHSLQRYQIGPGQVIYDPFMGSGTTNVVAKMLGISSYGVEAHPFVYRIAKSKMNWDIDLKEIWEFIDYVEGILPDKSALLASSASFKLDEHFPELVLKCYEPQTLLDLMILRDIVLEYSMSDGARDFFFVVVTALLREVSSAATGWPYIAPKKQKVSSIDKQVLREFQSLARRMAEDIRQVTLASGNRFKNTEHRLLLCDSQNTSEHIEGTIIDHVFTSPPYLNNFDYADRTRLELYFWGEAQSWGDITLQIRDRLMTSATTQIRRSDSRYEVSEELKNECPQVANIVLDAVTKLGKLRQVKGGKKSYDLMVAGYFNEIHRIVRDVYRVLKPATKALFVLGDSAPYGVYIPTDKLIGEIGQCVGFESYELELLRTRGDKWRANPQRHSVGLRESIVILSKG